MAKTGKAKAKVGKGKPKAKAVKVVAKTKTKAGAKKGRPRQDFAVADCFAPLFAWILSHWSNQRLVLALDPTSAITSRSIGTGRLVMTMRARPSCPAIPLASRFRA